MQTLQLATEDAGKNRFGAVRNAELLNAQQQRTYSQAQQRQAVTARDLLDTAYNYSELYINYRKKFIAIKLEGAQARSAIVKEVEALFAEQGYSRVDTPQGIIYRIPRAVM
jgi:hypothetical protein